MQFFITKTGLDAFDVARAWGLTVLLNVLTEEEVKLQDVGWAFILQPATLAPEDAKLAGLGWRTLIKAEDVRWQQVFMTLRKKQEKLSEEEVSQVQQVLESNWQSLMRELRQPNNAVTIGQGKTLPGGLEPSAFKSLRHDTKASYGEEQLRVPEKHWALACLGMATCGTYRLSREAGQSNWLALLPIPQSVRFNYFRDVQQLLRPHSIRYRGVQSAAAHYAVQLVEGLRRRAAAQGSLQDQFSAVLYFTLFGAGQQTKPSQGSQLNLAPLMQLVQDDPHGSEVVLKWLDYCFRLGATEGAEDLALAATELVMRWDLDAYERLVRVLVRFVAKKQVKYENLPNEGLMRRVMKYVAA
ncbi:MAG: hypothetical protein QXQ64_09190 [Candidatus Bathyarchaeia archaeon]